MPDPTTDGFQASADYLHIDVALKSLWQPFNDLVAEMDSFAPRPLSDYEDDRRQKFDNYKRLNPTKSDAELTQWVDGEIAFAASERVQFSDRFSNRFMTQYVTVALLSHALCEAAINSILAIGLVKRESQELFSVLEAAPVKEKWRVGPKSFFPTYELNPGTALFETLNHLTKRRNALVHNKIHLHIGDKKILEGSKFERMTFQESTRWMRRFFSLPYDLAAHARSQLKDPSIFVLSNSVPIVTAAAHKTPNPSLQPTPPAAAELKRWAIMKQRN